MRLTSREITEWAAFFKIQADDLDNIRIKAEMQAKARGR